MLEWLVRGAGAGRVTTAYPAVAQEPPAGFQGRIDILDGSAGDPRLADLCPTGAIAVGPGGDVRLDRARCILCGACVRGAPERFAFRARYETAARTRGALVAGAERDASPAAVRRALGERVGALRRSVHLRHVDAGSDGSEEWEIAALLNPYYDIQRLGMSFTASPRHADILLVTGAVTEPMRAPLLRTWEAMPAPKAVVAVGTDACSGGLAADGATAGGVDAVLDVHVYVPGAPPAPIAILHGLLLATGALTEGAP
jgi:Ni,Fe-hydrogenase III small subunit/ferredoxin